MTNPTEDGRAARRLGKEDMVETLAGALLNISDDYTPDYCWGQEYIRRNAGEEHSGDCTKCPWTCIRCVVDDYTAQAKALLPFVLSLQTSEASGSTTLPQEEQRGGE